MVWPDSYKQKNEDRAVITKVKRGALYTGPGLLSFLFQGEGPRGHWPGQHATCSAHRGGRPFLRCFLKPFLGGARTCCLYPDTTRGTAVRQTLEPAVNPWSTTGVGPEFCGKGATNEKS